MEDSPAVEYLIGVRLRETAQADDYKLAGFELHVGDICIVDTAAGTAFGEVRRPRRLLPDFKRDHAYRRVVGKATTSEAQEWRARREREERAIETCRVKARDKGLLIKVVDVELEARG